MVAFRKLRRQIPPAALDHMLISTLEPCVMCTGAAMESGIDDRLRPEAPADSGTGQVTPPESPESQMPRIVPQILAEQSRALFKRFQHTATDPMQRAFVSQLLALTSLIPGRSLRRAALADFFPPASSEPAAPWKKGAIGLRSIKGSAEHL